MVALQQKDGSFLESTQLDVLEHTAEISSGLREAIGINPKTVLSSHVNEIRAAYYNIL